MVPAVTYLTEIAYVANGPTINVDLSIKIILKKNIYIFKKDANEFYVYMKNVFMVLLENIFEYGPKVSMDHISWWKKKSWRLDHKLKSN